MTRGRGQPTKYNPQMCDKFLEMRSEGKTIEQFCAAVNIHVDTVYEWKKVNPEFSEAFRMGKVLSLAKWQDKLEVMMLDKNVNSALVKLYFANCFGWHDKTENTQNINVTEHIEKARQSADAKQKRY